MKKNLKVKIIALSLVVLMSTGGIVYAVAANRYEPYEKSGLSLRIRNGYGAAAQAELI